MTSPKWLKNFVLQTGDLFGIQQFVEADTRRISTGYIGPAYKNTEERLDRFETTWCEDNIPLKDETIWVDVIPTNTR